MFSINKDGPRLYNSFFFRYSALKAPSESFDLFEP